MIVPCCARVFIYSLDAGRKRKAGGSVSEGFKGCPKTNPTKALTTRPQKSFTTPTSKMVGL